MLALGLSANAVSLVIHIVFFSAAGLSIILGLILFYHWLRFAMNPLLPLFAFAVYGSVCVALLTIMFGMMYTL